LTTLNSITDSINMERLVKLILLIISLASSLFFLRSAIDDFTDIGATIHLSILNPAQASQRESAFTIWMEEDVAQSYLEAQIIKDFYPLYSEDKQIRQARQIYRIIPPGAKFWTRTHCDIRHLLNYHQEYTSQGYELLTLHRYSNEYGRNRYSATWITPEGLPQALRDLADFGISRASLKP
jgi:hypothetical protein